ncbi:unnamed protein product [Fraxinus pennsylvanica]|uniref:DUF4283 domain-containing protein n=1 Tax=Fraxinus pennsylvanica TaxID=56036 RepID=A0AAD1ZHH1_9LAMI|nr:unnamed protein product [Fraxinus pennsylvanica]
MGETSTALAKGVQQGRSFLEAAKQPVGGDIQATPPLQLRRPKLIDGELGFIFTDAKVKRLAEDFRFALVLKFLSSRPNIDLVRAAITKTWGLREVPVVSYMDASHVLVKMNNEGDFLHAWAREGRFVAGASFRLFKWTPDFDLHRESSLAPQWLFLPGLPLHLYRQDCLRILASRFGRYLGTDHATLNRTRASGARICVEIDLLADVVECFPITVGSTTLWQCVQYEKLGFYCKKCRRQGHTEAVCRVGQQFHEKQKMKKVVTIGLEKQEWRQKKGNVGNDVGIGKRYVHDGGDIPKLDASGFGGSTHGQRSDNIEKVGESSKGISLFVGNDKETRDVTQTELGRDNNMDEDGTVASKNSGMEIAKLGGDIHMKPLGGDYLVDGKQTREEGEIEDMETILNGDMVVTTKGNEQINEMTMHIMVRTEDDQGVKDSVEESQEDSRDHGSANEALTMSDKEVEGMVEELGIIRDCISDSEQMAKEHPRKTVHKVRSSSMVPSRPSRLNL